MNVEIKQSGKFHYIEEGEGRILLLLHGLFGALSNYKDVFNAFCKDYKVVIPLLPIYELPLKQANLEGLVKHVTDFVNYMGYDKVNVLGNSLGGHIAILYALENKEKITSMILTGSSGLYENSLGATFPKRGNYEFIKTKTEYTFYDPKTATKELVEEVFEIVNNRNKAIRVIKTAKSAIRNNVGSRLHELDCPVLLIWGKNDNITPPFVGEDFKNKLPRAELYLIDKCGHAPMMERPEIFNKILKEFLDKVYQTTAT